MSVALWLSSTSEGFILTECRQGVVLCQPVQNLASVLGNKGYRTIKALKLAISFDN